MKIGQIQKYFLLLSLHAQIHPNANRQHGYSQATKLLNEIEISQKKKPSQKRVGAQFYK